MRQSATVFVFNYAQGFVFFFGQGSPRSSSTRDEMCLAFWNWEFCTLYCPIHRKYKHTNVN